MRSSKKGQVRCYLSAPAQTDTSALRGVFKQLGVLLDSADELPPSGASLPGGLRERLREVDFVCGVLPEGPGAGNVLFELGVAAGTGRPIFIVAQDTATFPIALQAYPHVETTLHDNDAIRFHVEIFLQNLQRSTRAALSMPQPVTSRIKPAPGAVAILRKRSTAPNLSEAGLAQTVADVFSALGAQVITAPAIGQGSMRPDIVAWLPNSPPDLGAPFVIEVAHPYRQQDREAMLGQVERYLTAASCRTGLLIAPWSESEIEVRITQVGGYVFSLSLNTLLDLAQKGRLIARLIEVRNRSAHAGR